MAARALMVAGTASHVGKSWMATAICRWLRRRGVRVAPFKAQNMSLNSYPAVNGGEIGRAQVAQAEACGLAPTTDMNPILLKPTSPTGCQVIVNGRVWKDVGAQAYGDHTEFLWGEVERAYCRLSSEFEFVVIEGAGGVAELNLRSRDLVNLPLALRVGAPVLLVADIDRGGVFGSVVGTLLLLPEEERELVRAVAVNRFRGDPALFEEGRVILEERSGKPCLGVFPFAEGIFLDSEDSVCLDQPTQEPGCGPGHNPGSSLPLPREEQAGSLDIAIVRLPHISNFTDFSLLPEARYITAPTETCPDCIILPGSKNTIGDLRWLWRTGLAEWILRCRAAGAGVWGVCGGFQMLGKRVADPEGVEEGGEAKGLALLPVETVLRSPKVTRSVEAVLTRGGFVFDAYEIHCGVTSPAAGVSPFATIDGRAEGFRQDGVVGAYLHGAFENPDVLHSLLSEVAERRGKPAPSKPAPASKDEHYERMADWFEGNADLELFERSYLDGVSLC